MSMRVWILGIFVLIAVMMYMPQVNAQNNNSVNEQNKDESYFFLSPLKQIQNGVLPEFVQCNENLDLMFKISDNSPVCLTWDTRDELFLRETVWVGEKYIKIDTDKQRYILGETVQITMKNISDKWITSGRNHVFFDIFSQEVHVVSSRNGEILSVDSTIIPPLDRVNEKIPTDYEEIVYWNQTNHKKEAIKIGNYTIQTEYFVPWKQDGKEFTFPIVNQTLHHFEIVP